MSSWAWALLLLVDYFQSYGWGRVSKLGPVPEGAGGRRRERGSFSLFCLLVCIHGLDSLLCCDAAQGPLLGQQLCRLYLNATRTVRKNRSPLFTALHCLVLCDVSPKGLQLLCTQFSKVSVF